MKIVTRAVLDMHTMQWLPELEESYEYSGPVALAVRKAADQASNAADTAKSTAANYGAEASQEHAALDPFALNEMHAQHLYTPEQTGELLTSAESGAGAATGAAAGQAGREAARTRNATGYTKNLDELARDRAKADAGASEGIASQDIMGAKELNQRGADLLSGMYKTDTGAQLNAMGQQAEDVNAETNASKAGWMQNMDNTIAAVAGLKPKFGGGNGFSMGG